MDKKTKHIPIRVSINLFFDILLILLMFFAVGFEVSVVFYLIAEKMWGYVPFFILLIIGSCGAAIPFFMKMLKTKLSIVKALHNKGNKNGNSNTLLIDNVLKSEQFLAVVNTEDKEYFFDGLYLLIFDNVETLAKYLKTKGLKKNSAKFLHKPIDKKERFRFLQSAYNNGYEGFIFVTEVGTVTINFEDIPNLKKPEPITFSGQTIELHPMAYLAFLKKNTTGSNTFEARGCIALSEKTPTITLVENNVKTCEYCLQTEKNEDFTGKYFLVSVRLSIMGNPAVPVAQIDGFISDTPEERKMTMNDIGYRMEGYFLDCGGENSKIRQDMNRGQDLPMKALKYQGYTTQTNIRLIGICPECRKSFAFHGYAFYMSQSDVAYSDDGLDCCEIRTYDIDKDTWSYKEEGKTFRYYNSFSCPYCGTPYIDYKKFPQNKKFGVSGCVHLGRKHYTAQ